MAEYVARSGLGRASLQGPGRFISARIYMCSGIGIPPKLLPKAEAEGAFDATGRV